MKLSAHFSLEEFTISSKALSMGVRNDPTQAHLENLKHLAERMEAVRALFNRPIEITSATAIRRSTPRSAACRPLPTPWATPPISTSTA
ncbi:hypothetical protein ASD89_04310 [Caulobacter sp. Root656]|nr:hypothetical protein ASD89_04310 [Caulobacter sp. Root656]